MTLNLPNLRPSQIARKPNFNIENIVDNFFNNFHHPLTNSLFSIADNEFSPRLDVSETDKDYRLELELPGINKEDIDIKLENNIITIKGEKKMNNEHKDSSFYTRERFYGTFSRALVLPTDIKSEEVETIFKDGVLTMKIPKAKDTNAKQIKIK